MARHNELGKRGEKEAKDFLIGRGYEILEMNWRFQKFELDIIAFKDNTICCIEVKTRRDLNQKTEEIISESKEKNLIEAANAYLESNANDYECRIDLILIEENNDEFCLTHIEDAIRQA